MSIGRAASRLLIMLAPLLCAGCLTTSVAMEPPPPPDCDAYVPDELKQDTKHAPAPPAVAAIVGQPNPLALDITKNWIDFGIAEAGQLEKSNADRRAERHIRQV